MTNKEIRARGWQIYKTSFLPLTAVGAAVTLLSLAEILSENSALVLTAEILSLLASIVTCYFFMRCWADGRAELKNLGGFFTQPVYSERLLPVIGFELLVYCGMFVPLIVGIIASVKLDKFWFLSVGPMALIWVILITVAAVAFSLVWEIFIFEPQLKVTELFKKSAKYMGRHWLDILWFNFTLNIIPGIIVFLLSEYIDAAAVNLIMIPARTYVTLTSYGYIYEAVIAVERQREMEEEKLSTDELPAVENCDAADETAEEQA